MNAKLKYDSTHICIPKCMNNRKEIMMTSIKANYLHKISSLHKISPDCWGYLIQNFNIQLKIIINSYQSLTVSLYIAIVERFASLLARCSSLAL